MQIATIKHCTGCRSDKPTEDFTGNRTSPDGLQDHCRQCFRERHARKHPQHNRRGHVWRNYGMIWIDYVAMWEAQGRSCKICSRPVLLYGPNKLVVAHPDHDHTTGIVRGLLCHFCNSGVGYFRENPTLLLAAADYLLESRRKI